MAHTLIVPTSAKIRLCPSAPTTELGRVLEHAGASRVTLHARHVSARRRRQGAADLDAVRDLKATLGIPVVSNGNVRTYADVVRNGAYTHADGLMVGEALLGNPCLFAGETVRDPVLMAMEYLEVCKGMPVAALKTMQAHVRYMIEFQCARRPWYSKFRLALNECQSVDDVEVLLCRKVRCWRGKAAVVLGTPSRGQDDDENSNEYSDMDNP